MIFLIPALLPVLTVGSPLYMAYLIYKGPWQ